MEGTREKRPIHLFLAFRDGAEMISGVTTLVREKVRPFEGVVHFCVLVVTRHNLQKGGQGEEEGGKDSVLSRCRPRPDLSTSMHSSCTELRRDGEDVSTHGEIQSRYLSLSFSLFLPTLSQSLFSLSDSLALILLKSQPWSLLMRSRRNQDNYFSEATIFCSLFSFNKQNTK